MPADYWTVLDPALAQREAQRRRARGPQPIALVGGGPSRGVFELRPDTATRWADPGSRSARAAAGSDGWTLWWRPLPREAPVDPRQLDPTADELAVPLASGLTRCRWRVFANRRQGDEINAVWMHELPAYVMLDVQTTAGLSASWVFEVGWTNGPEFPRAEPGEDAGEPAEGETGRRTSPTSSGVTDADANGTTSKRRPRSPSR